jgi:hypothetical protein
VHTSAKTAAANMALKSICEFMDGEGYAARLAAAQVEVRACLLALPFMLHSLICSLFIHNVFAALSLVVVTVSPYHY